MSDDLRSLLIEQLATIDAIKRVLVNFKKLTKVNVTLPKTKSRLAGLETLWSKCQALHIRILQTATAEEQRSAAYFVNEDFLRAEDVYLETSDHISEVLGRFVHAAPAPSAGSSDSSFRDAHAGPSLQLPRITLPKFSGALTEWENFRGMFESLIANNEALSNSQKLHYLKASVTGQAALLINNIKVSESNYDAAWGLLVSEYDDKPALIHAHIHAFADLPVMKTETAADLKRLRDSVSASLAALSNLGRPVGSWDDLLIYIITQKFSPRTRNEWNLKRGNSGECPTYKEIHDFVTVRVRGLTEYASSREDTVVSGAREKKTRTAVNNVSVIKCSVCPGSHGIFRCDEFAGKSVDQRSTLVKQRRLCFNCLKQGHASKSCPSQSRCKHCGQAHHSLLHRSSAGGTSCDAENMPLIASPAVDPARSAVSAASDAAASASIQNVLTLQSSAHTHSNVLLATAWVALRTAEGRSFKVRALLDQGSTLSFISESLCQLMHTRRHRAGLLIRCFGEKFSGVAKSCVHLTLAPCSGQEQSLPLTGYVYQRITSYAASRVRPMGEWPHLRDLPLADPDPAGRQPIHLLIGADLYGALLLNDLRKGPLESPTAQLTIFGWIISGPSGHSDALAESPHIHCISGRELDASLQRFWEDESLPTRSSLKDEDIICEEHFLATHSRTPQGRYVVRLPFRKAPPLEIGGSLQIATLLHSKMEKRLSQRPAMALRYRDFLAEYESLGHMEIVDSQELSRFPPVYIPHHPVLRNDGSSTKLRVVFNASCKTGNGSTLNDHLHVGPKLQQDLPAVILRWRMHCYVYKADIAKMFRQILVHRDDADFQRILWRPTEGLPLQHYRLLTVTYGLAPAPFLAMRVLLQLAKDEGGLFPKALPIFEDSIYVDDALFGADNLEMLRDSRDQLVSLMGRGGFQLRKWAANSLALLTDIPEDQRELSDQPLVEDDSLKVLGLTWLPNEDSFRFVISLHQSVNPTKRSVLAFIARLFDPLGWASPVVITAKIMMQELWLRRLDWDAPIPDDQLGQWVEYCAGLPCLSEIRIPRWVGIHGENLGVELHGFADASSRAYAAVVYLRVLHSLADAQVSLICAKTKVAPIKTLSIPRLELNAVVLLCRLVEWVQSALKLPQLPLYGWTDSTVTLSWLRGHPSRWNSYVANRVSEIQTRNSVIRWNHVRSKDNPADCASRGLPAAALDPHPLWWTGPPWLRKPSASWPIHTTSPPLNEDESHAVLAEARKCTAHHIGVSLEWDLPDKYSSWTRLRRITALLRRFISNIRAKMSSKSIVTTALAADELKEASLFWLGYVQSLHFANELKALKAHSVIARSSPLRSLDPLLGENGLIRLGGRLENASFSYDERHPVILPKHRVSELLIDHAHQVSLHGGTQLTLRILRQRYWILSARSLVKTHIHRCLVCVRHSARTATQKMGNLPHPRVNPSPPFTHTGVDYAGPMNLTSVVGRGKRTTKHYVAIFVCFASKAVHLECVDDYTTAGFLAAFQRFVSRRGLPSQLYSDNGTNFQGADRELRENFEKISRDPSLAAVFANDHVAWNFIPAAAPHFGGLWEAGVKCFKRHLKRVMGSHTLSRVEFGTLLCRIEACMNSRPISALSDDPQDLSALTPGHFLIGRPLVSVPEEPADGLAPNRLTRWQRVRAMQEQIWRSWSADYLHSLQLRHKWRETETDLQKNELVLIKNNLLPPSRWGLARVSEVHPGRDKLVRVVTLRTATGECRRPITQICRLPVFPCKLGSEHHKVNA